jgi:calcineurin-like phosphoesterase family protein
MTTQTRQKSIRIDHDVRFIADTHFAHPLMISMERKQDGVAQSQLRAFNSMREHDEALIGAWNDSVKPKQTVYHLGDFGFWRAEVEDLERIFKKLNGKKVLIPGNHDSLQVMRFGWQDVLHGVVHWLDADKSKIVGSHHPQREWDSWHGGALHFHGHTHGSLPSSRRSMDVGVDSIGRWPLSATDIRAHMSQLPELDFRGVVTIDFALNRGDAEQTNEDSR